jgi:hypothetical protein
MGRERWVGEGEGWGSGLGHPGAVVGNQIRARTGVGDPLALSRTRLVVGSIGLGGEAGRWRVH